MRKEQSGNGIRWDKVFGLMTLFAIMILTIMIFIDYKPLSNLGKSDAETVDNEDVEEDTEEETEEIQYKATVCIDAGHGGSDNGSVVGTEKEKDQTLAMALKIQEKLEEQEIKVVMTRTTDTFVSDEDRVAISNEAEASATISIHRNAYEGSGNVYGAEAWIHTSAPTDSESLASGILAKLKTDVDEDNRGVKYGTVNDFTADYYINTKCKSASTILELGYMTSTLDDGLVTTNSDATAKSIADGIVQYLKTQGYMNE